MKSSLRKPGDGDGLPPNSKQGIGAEKQQQGVTLMSLRRAFFLGLSSDLFWFLFLSLELFFVSRRLRSMTGVVVSFPYAPCAFCCLSFFLTATVAVSSVLRCACTMFDTGMSQPFAPIAGVCKHV